MKNKLGTLIVMSGPSGTGKSSILNKVIENLEDINFSVSCTTRQPRAGEVDGESYHFISQEEFDERVNNSEFIEYATVHGNSYGTLRSEVIQHLCNGEDVILDIDVQGALLIKEEAKKDDILNQCIETVFVAPPSYEELEGRLRGRNTETEVVVNKRLSAAKKELDAWNKYDYLVINDDLEEAILEMNSIIISFRRKTKKMNNLKFY